MPAPARSPASTSRCRAHRRAGASRRSLPTASGSTREHTDWPNRTQSPRISRISTSHYPTSRSNTTLGRNSLLRNHGFTWSGCVRWRGRRFYRLSYSGPLLLAISLASQFVAWLQTRDELAVCAGLCRPVIVLSGHFEKRGLENLALGWPLTSLRRSRASGGSQHNSLLASQKGLVLRHHGLPARRPRDPGHSSVPRAFEAVVGSPRAARPPVAPPGERASPRHRTAPRTARPPGGPPGPMERHRHGRVAGGVERRGEGDVAEKGVVKCVDIGPHQTDHAQLVRGRAHRGREKDVVAGEEAADDPARAMQYVDRPGI